MKYIFDIWCVPLKKTCASSAPCASMSQEAFAPRCALNNYDLSNNINNGLLCTLKFVPLIVALFLDVAKDILSFLHLSLLFTKSCFLGRKSIVTEIFLR